MTQRANIAAGDWKVTTTLFLEEGQSGVEFDLVQVKEQDRAHRHP